MNQHYRDNACPVSERHASTSLLYQTILCYKQLDYILQFNTTIENYKAIYYTYLTWHGISTEVLHDFNSGHYYQRLSRLYKDIWVPIIGEILFCEQEPWNEEDHFAVAGHQLSNIWVLLIGIFGLPAEL